MLDIAKEPTASGTRENRKKTHAIGSNIAEIAKELKHKLKNKLKLKLLRLCMLLKVVPQSPLMHMVDRSRRYVQRFFEV
jgi:hypothetical protein